MLSRSVLAARPQWRFLLVGAGWALLWWLGYGQVLGPDGRLDHALSVQVAQAAAWGLRAAGFVAATAASAPTTVRVAGQPAVLVGDPCNGLVLYAVFVGFVLAYPGSLRRKAWFIPLGVGAVYLLNVARVAALALNQAYWHHTVEFNHHYTFTVVSYAAILGLWQWWARLNAAVGPPYAPGR